MPEVPRIWLSDLGTDLRALNDAASHAVGFARADHRSQKGSGDEVLDNALMRLAEIYLEARGEDGPIERLSPQPRSIFIRFCHLALKAKYGEEEDLSLFPEALSNRWKRLRMHLSS